ncbi:MAG: hypothetical protein V2A69_00425, partial [Pseudomonadota bacterium]
MLETGSIVILNLENPKEKILGKLISISPSGIVIKGVNVNSFSEWVNQFSQPRVIPAIIPTTIFFPMHRVLSCYLDEDIGEVPSFSSQFIEKTE